MFNDTCPDATQRIRVSQTCQREEVGDATHAEGRRARCADRYQRRLRAERSWGAVGGPWIAVSAFDGLFGFEVVLESAFLR